MSQPHKACMCALHSRRLPGLRTFGYASSTKGRSQAALVLPAAAAARCSSAAASAGARPAGSSSRSGSGDEVAVCRSPVAAGSMAEDEAESLENCCIQTRRQSSFCARQEWPLPFSFGTTPFEPRFIRARSTTAPPTLAVASSSLRSPAARPLTQCGRPKNHGVQDTVTPGMPVGRGGEQRHAGTWEAQERGE